MCKFLFFISFLSLSQIWAVEDYITDNPNFKNDEINIKLEFDHSSFNNVVNGMNGVFESEITFSPILHEIMSNAKISIKGDVKDKKGAMAMLFKIIESEIKTKKGIFFDQVNNPKLIAEIFKGASNNSVIVFTVK